MAETEKKKALFDAGEVETDIQKEFPGTFRIANFCVLSSEKLCELEMVRERIEKLNEIVPDGFYSFTISKDRQSIILKFTQRVVCNYKGNLKGLLGPVTANGLLRMQAAVFNLERGD